MNPIGRKLVFCFGKQVIAIEIYPTAVSPYIVDEHNGLLFDLVDFDGEKIEQPLGNPVRYCYGQDMNGHMPSYSGEAWMTPDEYKARSCQPAVEV